MARLRVKCTFKNRNVHKIKIDTPDTHIDTELSRAEKKSTENGLNNTEFAGTAKADTLKFISGIRAIFQDCKAPFWEKEIFPDEHSNIAPGQSGIVAYDYHLGLFRKKINGSAEWLPVYKNFQLKGIIDVFETPGGTVFIVCDRGRGLFRSADNGKNWKEVSRGVINLTASNGVLMANSINGVIRSTDDGETWETVISEGGVGIHIAPIDGGFAAITFNTQSETRRLRASYDNGKTWQTIDAGLPPSKNISSIIQVGDAFFCGHPNGIYRSGDKGKTWKLLLPSIEGKVFNLSVSGNVIYAIPGSGGC